ncbi:MAG: hypothetical protein Kow0032_07740 [Methyloligellaceae bacterium]
MRSDWCRKSCISILSRRDLGFAMLLEEVIQRLTKQRLNSGAALHGKLAKLPGHLCGKMAGNLLGAGSSGRGSGT